MIRDIMTIMRGTAAAQAIGFVALPLLARLFEPAAFGHYQVFISSITLLLVLPTLRYEVALLRADDRREVSGLLKLCFILSVLVAAAIALAVAAAHFLVPNNLSEDLPFPLWTLIIVGIFGGISQFLNLFATREKAFSIIANAKVWQACGYAFGAVAIGYFTANEFGLIFADLAGRVILFGFLVFWLMRKAENLEWRIDTSYLKILARRYREYPLISTPGTLINVMGGILTPIMIYATFTPSASGQYGLLERSVILPVSFIILAVGQVFTAQFSDQLRNDRRSALKDVEKLLKVMGAIGIALVVGLVALGPFLFEFVFGEEWIEAGRLSRLMAPGFATMLLSGPIHMVLTVLGHQKIQTAWEVGRLVLVCGLWASVPAFGFGLHLAVALYSAILVICNMAFVVLAYTMLRRAISTDPTRADMAG